MHAAEALCAIFNPTVNSYKRINAPRTLSGATWAPNAVSYTGNNRTHMIRIPDAGPVRAAAAGRRGQPLPAAGGDAGGGAATASRNKRDPGKRLDINMYTDGHTAEGRQELPLNLLDAIRLTEKSKALRSTSATALSSRYCTMKIDRVELIHAAPDRVGAAEQSGLLIDSRSSGVLS